MSSTGSWRARRRLALVVTIAMGLALAGCGGSGSGPGGADGGGATAKLRFSYFSGETTSFGKLWTWWMAEVEKRSGGTVEFEPFWDGTLLKAEEVADGLKDGRVDISQVTPSYYLGKFPLTSVAELPFVTANVPAGAAAMTALAGEDRELQDEWRKQGLKPVVWNVAPSSAFGSKDPVVSVADLRGKKVRGIDRSAKALAAVGANIVTVGVPEMYGSMERSLINAYFGIPLGFVGPLKLNEVSDHLTDLGMGISTASALSMSDQGWNKLTPEQRRVMVEVSAEAPAKLATFDAEAEDASCKALRESGTDVRELPAAEVQRLKGAIRDRVHGEWEREIGGKGLPAAAFADRYERAVGTAAKTYPDYVPGVARCVRSGGSAR
ncbi:TRAP transporter substrate-binding protein DctP [Patulibacter sp.]|uniref:TRAP transporter substrate-binding protein DctP n=1 Tax=Patulibacter sp. TaxID=1912859 RepID=UPI002718CCBF|nr:TRAP transporter substrate-binding protein DctP [Patulibacter sp.]MDO9407701.1 TRAP transporter substrate-binding protein DctP [Patulibacter sp.]